MEKIRILIADDHKMFRSGIIMLLRKEPSFEIVGEASNGLEVIRMANEKKPDVVLMDIHLPKANGIEATKSIKASFPAAKILALTSFEEDEYVVNMVKAGALGYILKEAPIEELVIAIKALSKGNSYFAKEVSAKLFARLSQPERKPNGHSSIKKPLITDREFEVLRAIAEELTNKEIASKLFISPRTVETHRRNLIQKLKVKNTAGLVKYYM
ncbi:MAG: DNA-binding response regulator, partial [Bacteroidetes bacterium]